MVSKTLTIGILVICILVLVRFAWSTLQQSKNPSNTLPAFLKQEMKEEFKVAPTRAADCNCLAGYVPSKNTSDIYFCQSLSEPTKRRECY